MNYLITTVCPKKCPYCFFPNEQKNSMADMTVDMFARLFKHQLNLGLKNRVAFLGGEPTVASTFKDIMSYYLDHCFHVNSSIIFSNFAGTSNIRWLCDQNVPHNLSFVWNNTGIDTYAKNLQKAAYESAAILKEHGKFNVSLSLTYVGNTDIDYILFCRDTFDIRNMRFAVDSGSALYKEPEEINKLFTFLNVLVAEGFRINNDSCGTIWLPWFSEQQQNWLKTNIHLGSGCTGIAGDVLPDGSVIPCMPYWKVEKKLKFLDMYDIRYVHRFYNTVAGTADCPCGALA